MRDAYRFSRDRVWLLDDRDPPRQLHVTHHRDQDLVVLSIWHENVCTATFRLPAADTAAVIDILVAALADAAVRPAAVPASTRASAWSRIRDWARAHVSRLSA